MAHPEYQPQPSGFHDRITYEDPAFTPVSVAKSTSAVFRRYFSGNQIDRVSQIVLNDALRFIHNARVGLANNLREVDRGGRAYPEDVKLTQTVDGGATVPKDEELESFRFALLTMGIMPGAAKIYFKDIEGHYLEFGFTRRGMLAPPFTTVEAYVRLRELARETDKILRGDTDTQVHILKDQAVVRTKMFFETAADIPLKNPVA